MFRTGGGGGGGEDVEVRAIVVWPWLGRGGGGGGIPFDAVVEALTKELATNRAVAAVQADIRALRAVEAGVVRVCLMVLQEESVDRATFLAHRTQKSFFSIIE